MEVRPSSDIGQVTQLLQRWREGDSSALADLTPLVYAELRTLARSRLAAEKRQGISPTELVHEAFMRLVRTQQPEWVNRAHFYYIASRLMRQVLVDFVRETNALKRGGGVAAVSLDALGDCVPAANSKLLQVHEALNALSEIDERKSRILEMRYFGGMTAEEIASVEGLAPVTVTRDVRAATAWLRAWMRDGAE